MADCKGKTVLFVVPAARFKDDEYVKPRGVLERKGVKVVCASTKEMAVFGLGNARAKIDLQLSAVDVSLYDAIYYVGGVGVKDYYQDEHALRIAREAAAQGRIVAAIDLAPTLLAKAGILTGRKATEYFSESKMIQTMGVEYTAATVTQDGNILTGKGPEAAEPLAMLIVKALEALPAPT